MAVDRDKTRKELIEELAELRARLVKDISERKQAEDGARLAEFALENAGDAVFWLDKDTRFAYVNRAACESLGYSREELLTMRISDIDRWFPPEAFQRLAEAPRRGKSPPFETRHQTKD